MKKTKTNAFDWALIHWARSCEENDLIDAKRLEATLDAEKDERGRLLDPLAYLAERASCLLDAAHVSGKRWIERSIRLWFFSAFVVVALGALCFPLARVKSLLDGGVNLAGPFVFFLLGQIFCLGASLIMVGVVITQSLMRKIMRKDRPLTFAEKALNSLTNIIGTTLLFALHKCAPTYYTLFGGRTTERFAWKRRRTNNVETSGADVSHSTRFLSPEVKSSALFWDVLFSRPRYLFFWGGFLSHLFWASCSICVLTILCARMQGNRYDYCWRTSLEDERAVKKCVDFLGAPILALGGNVPTEAEVASLFDERKPVSLGVKEKTEELTEEQTALIQTEAKTRSHWSFFLLGIVFIWCVFPRFVLVCVYYLLFRHALGDFRPDLKEPYFQRVVADAESYLTTTESSYVDDPEETETSRTPETSVVSSEKEPQEKKGNVVENASDIPVVVPEHVREIQSNAVNEDQVEEVCATAVDVSEPILEAETNDVPNEDSVKPQVSVQEEPLASTVAEVEVETESLNDVPETESESETETEEAFDKSTLIANFVDPEPVAPILIEELEVETDVPQDVETHDIIPPKEERVLVVPVLAESLRPTDIPEPHVAIERPEVKRDGILVFGYDASLANELWRELLNREPTYFEDVVSDFSYKKALRDWLTTNGETVALCAFVTDSALSPARHFMRFMRETLLPAIPNARVVVVLTGGEKLRLKYGTETNAIAERVEDWNNALKQLANISGLSVEPVFYDADLALAEPRKKLRDVLRRAYSGKELVSSDESFRTFEKWDAAAKRVVDECRSIFDETELILDEESERLRIADVCGDVFKIYQKETDRIVASGSRSIVEQLGSVSVVSRLVDASSKAATSAIQSVSESEVAKDGLALGGALVERCKERGLSIDAVEKRLKDAWSMSEKMRAFCGKLSPKCAVATASIGLSIPAVVAFAPLLGGAVTASAAASAIGVLGTLLPTSLVSGALGGALGAVAPMSLSSCKEKLTSKIKNVFSSGTNETTVASVPSQVLTSDLQSESTTDDRSGLVVALVYVSATWIVVLELQGRAEDEIVAAMPELLRPIEEGTFDSLEDVVGAFDAARALLETMR